MIPCELDEVAVPASLQFFSLQYDSLTVELHLLLQNSFFPFLQVTDQASPAATLGLLENQSIIMWLDRFQAENLDPRTCLFLKQKTRLDHPCIIEYHQGTFRQVIRNMLENAFADFSFLI